MTETIPTLFTVYYMNRQKVFETRMLLDNKLKTAGSKENHDHPRSGWFALRV